MVTHGSQNFREPQPGSEYPQTAKNANNGRRVKVSHWLFFLQYIHVLIDKNKGPKMVRNQYLSLENTDLVRGMMF